MYNNDRAPVIDDNKMYNRLCQELNVRPDFIMDPRRLKQRIEELKVKARKNPSSLFYMT